MKKFVKVDCRPLSVMPPSALLENTDMEVLLQLHPKPVNMVVLTEAMECMKVEKKSKAPCVTCCSSWGDHKFLIVKKQ